MGKLAGRVAVVTGGASGIGLASVRRLAADGAQVVAVDINPAGEVKASRAGARFVRADVGDAAGWDRIVQQSLELTGAIDIALLNAAVPLFEPDILAVSAEALERAISVNVKGVVLGIQAIAPHMQAHGGGDIVITSSLAGLMAYGADPVYAMTKHGVVGLARSVARALQAARIRVNTVCPGPVDTPLLPADVRASVEAAGLRPLDPSEVADAIIEVIAAARAGSISVVLPGRPVTEYEFAPVSRPVPTTERGVS